MFCSFIQSSRQPTCRCHTPVRIEMVIKRELDMDSQSEYEDEDIKPIITPAKSKKTKTTPSQKTPSPVKPTITNTVPEPVSASHSISPSPSSSPSSSKKTKVDPNAKRTIAEEIINVGIKGINVDSLARAVCPFIHIFLHPRLERRLMFRPVSRLNKSGHRLLEVVERI